ncbi:MAG: hypothetical protein JNG89_17170, partial [Planctomycetaceae bacterium]|nr:hypothetical protein [Planctomycetaceae bacterium]
ADAEPLALHPENPHYFIWQGQPTILVTSGEHYGALLNLDFDYPTYLEALAEDGLNHTRVFAGTYRELPGGHGIVANTLAPAPGRFLAPWKRSEVPGYLVGGNKFDLSDFNPEYLQRLRGLMTEARDRGVVVELTLFCPLYSDGEWIGSPFHPENNINGIGDWPRDETLTLQHPEVVAIQEEFTRHIVRELNDFDNLYYEVCNEPYQRGVPDDWQARIVDVIVQTEQSLPHRHLISLNIANGAQQVETLPEGVSILNFHYCVPPEAVAMNFGLDCVIGENETGFRGGHDFLYRSEGWNFLLAGGGLYNSLDYSFTVEHPAGDLAEYRAPGGGSAALRRQLGVLKRFLDEFDLVHMRPDPDVVRSVSAGLECRALSHPGEACAIYVHVPVDKHPDDIEQVLRSSIRAELTVHLQTGSYQADWISPLSGDVLQSDAWQQTAGDRTLATPEFDNDVALRIRRTGPPSP